MHLLIHTCIFIPCFFFLFQPEASPRVTLKLKKPKSDKKVKWTTETVDNEHLNKKKSKCKNKYQPVIKVFFVIVWNHP